MTTTQMLIAPLENQLNQTEVLYIVEYVDDTEISSTETGFYYRKNPETEHEKNMIACMWKLAQRQLHMMQGDRLLQEVAQIGLTEAELDTYMSGIE